MDIVQKNRMLEIAGLPQVTTLNEGATHTAGNDYGVRYRVFAGKEGRLTTKEFWAKSEAALEKAIDKIQDQANFYEIDSYHYPPSKKDVKEAKRSIKESIADTYNIGNAIEFYLSMYEDMKQEDEEYDPATYTEENVQQYLRDMILDELRQALQDPQVKRRIVQTVGTAQQGSNAPDQRTLPV